MIKFKYLINSEIHNLIKRNVVGLDDPVVSGIIQENLGMNLKMKTLFLVCKSEYMHGTNILSNPLAIVASNDNQACDIYLQLTGNYGYIVHRLEEDCSKIKVYREDEEI